MDLSLVYIGFVFMLFLFNWRPVMATQCYPEIMDHCPVDTPFFCPHNNMCYGADQYCSKDEDKIQECLPDDAFAWCKANWMNSSGNMPNPQCTRACSYRFNETHYPTTLVEQFEGSGSEILFIFLLIAIGIIVVLFVVIVALILWIFKLYRQRAAANKSLHNNERVEIDTETADSDSTAGQLVDIKLVRHLSHEEEPAGAASSEETALISTSTTTDGQQINLKPFLRDLSTGQHTREERVEDGAGHEMAESPTSSNSSGGQADDSGYGSSIPRNPTAEGERSELRNPYPGRSGSAVEHGRPCRDPHPMPEQQEEAPVMMCPSGQLYNNSGFQ